MPRVSVLLTSYNHRDFLPIALESLRKQTFRDFEVLALDDGSQDGSREWLAQQPDVICHFHEKNLGTYGNLNFGVAHSTGEFIAVFNDDDVWDPRKLEQQVAVLDARPEVGLVHTAGWFIGPQGEKIEGSPLGFPWPETSSGWVLHELIYKNRIIASSAMFRRVLLGKTGHFDPEFWGCGDWHMWLRFAEQAQVVHLPDSLTFYRVHPNQACREEDKMIADSLRVREWIERRWPELSALVVREPELAAARAHNLACLGTERMWFGDVRGGRSAYWSALKLNPTRLKTALRLAATLLPTRAFRALR